MRGTRGTRGRAAGSGGKVAVGRCGAKASRRVAGPGSSGPPSPAARRRHVCRASEPLEAAPEQVASTSGDVFSPTDELMTYSVSLTNEATERGTQLKLSGKDRGRGLLSDVTFALASLELDVLMASIYTSEEDFEMEDTFIIRKDGRAVTEENFSFIEETVLAACLKSANLSALASLSSLDETAVLPGEEDAQDVLAATGEGAEGEAPMKWTFATVGSIALVNLAAALFGSNQVLIKLTETETSPSTLNLVRFGIAALAFLPFGIKTGAFKRPKLLTAATELATYLFIGYTAQVLGLGMTSASRGAVMAEFAVLIVPFWAKLSGEKIPNIVWYASVIALLGVVLVTEADGASSGFNLGDSLCLLSACCFGTHVFRTEKRTASIDNKDLPGLISLELTLLTLLSGVYELVDFSLHNPGGLQALDVQKVSYSLAHLPWTNLAAMGMGTTALTLFIEINALQNISSTLASLIYTTEPLWGAFFAAVFLKEKFGGLGYLGAAMIVGSTAYATVKGGVVKQTEKVKVD
ncbi:EamA-like transporter family protein [Chloropicon primus]|uniref:EamA domain-containing protein n=2 Tax=Chloropicon primus TaxID=1764295 RepID=A0A5B8MKU2_9CHLO|nr:hypothetical protein A3770_04p31820 [Chloropicon primus]UPQ99876.1 EamA-like transporter family protein [Chloropicon primus]|eukprot:QDZ20664.1 hypothetical protein A3770_04p31820 [Chloropicon primus]